MSFPTIGIVNSITANIQKTLSTIPLHALLDIFPINLSSYQRTLYQTVIVSQYDGPHLPDAATHLPQLSHKFRPFQTS